MEARLPRALNPNEQVKKDDHPLNVRARIENIYAKNGFDSIDKQDLRGRMRWWGLYTQRREGSTAPGPATRTSTFSKTTTS